MMQLLTMFGQEYNYYTFDGTAGSEGSGLSAVLLIPLVLFSIAFGVVCLASLWKIYVKAGHPGWAALIPIYNVIILLRIVGRPAWWVVLYLVGAIPFVGWAVALAVSIIVDNDLAKSFGKDAGFTVLLIFLPFIALPMLGYGDATFKRVAQSDDGDGTIQQ